MIGLALPAGRLSVLALGAHPDDIEIGCGGTLLRLTAERDVAVELHIMTSSPEREREARTAAALFLDGADTAVTCHGLPDSRLPGVWVDVKESLEAIAASAQPDVIFAPRSDDAHQDHRLIADLVSTVWRDAFVLHYEIPKWDGDLGRVTHYVALDELTARLKVQLLNESFASQRGRDWWRDDTFLALMRLRGVECRAAYAEGFLSPKTSLLP